MSRTSLAIFAELEDFVALHPEERISVRALVAHLGEDSLLLLLLAFSLFCAIPLPIPGIHVFLSAPLFYITIQQMMGRRTIWFPDSILERTLPRSGFVSMLERSQPWFSRLERWVHPRAQGLVDGRATYRVMGGVALFITCIIIIPLPLTNVVPALSIAVLTLGLLCRDGLTMILGAFVGLLWCVLWLFFAAVLGWAGMKGLYAILFS